MTRLKADLLLISATILWGSTFIISKNLLESITLADYMTIRFIIATLLICMILAARKERITRRSLIDGVIAGIVLYAVYMFQTGGLMITSATNTGFITGSYVIFVPLLSIVLFRQLPGIKSLAGILLALAGLFFISGCNFANFNNGDILVLINALLVGFHIILIYIFTRRNSPYSLTAVMIGTVALLSTFFSVYSGTSAGAFKLKPLAVLIYLAVFGTVYGFTVQSITQRYLSANRTALILTLEPLFAALFSILLGGETFHIFTLIGGLLIAAALMISQTNRDINKSI